MAKLSKFLNLKSPEKLLCSRVLTFKFNAIKHANYKLSLCVENLNPLSLPSTSRFSNTKAYVLCTKTINFQN